MLARVWGIVDVSGKRKKGVGVVAEEEGRLAGGSEADSRQGKLVIMMNSDSKPHWRRTTNGRTDLDRPKQKGKEDLQLQQQK